MNSKAKFEDLVGQTLARIEGKVGDEVMTFVTTEGRTFRMEHCQDCCENVAIEDICGDIEDLVNSPVVRASEDTSEGNPEGVSPEYQDSFTWTFYNIATAKGHVTIRWYGESNGYYSETVDFEEVLS